MALLAINLDVQDRLCLVIGGGSVAVRKVKTLLEAGARVLVVSPILAPALRQLAQAKKIEWKARAWKNCDLDRAWLVVAATADAEVNRQVHREARRRRLWLNAVDDPEHCSALFPSVLTRGGIQLAVSTSGLSPALARKIRESLESDWSEQAGACLDWIAGFREKVKREISDPRLRFAFWDRALTPQAVRLIQKGRRVELKRYIQSAWNKFQGSCNLKRGQP